MSGPPAVGESVDFEAMLSAGDVKGCCAAVYEHPSVRWLLGGDLHPGGKALTRRALELAALRPGERLVDVACGTGASALLAAREFGCEAVGVEFSEVAVAGALEAARDADIADRVGFVTGDAERLPLGNATFDVALCECSLCTFPDKAIALGEIQRVLRPGGRLALSDVTADHERLPAAMRGALATVACVGEAMPSVGYRALLADSGFKLEHVVDAGAEAAELANRVQERLRGARILGFDRLVPLKGGLDAAIELATQARSAIDEGALGYELFLARRS